MTRRARGAGARGACDARRRSRHVARHRSPKPPASPRSTTSSSTPRSTRRPPLPHGPAARRRRWRASCSHVSALWWQIQLDDESTALDAEFERRVEAAIAAADAWTVSEPQRAEAWFYLGAAYGARVQWRVLRAERVAAARDGKRIKEALEQALALDPSLHDARFGIGLYKYLRRCCARGRQVPSLPAAAARRRPRRAGCATCCLRASTARCCAARPTTSCTGSTSGTRSSRSAASRCCRGCTPATRATRSSRSASLRSRSSTSTIHRPASPRGRNCWRRPTPGGCMRRRSRRRAHASASAERLDELYETDRALELVGTVIRDRAGSTVRRARARPAAARAIRGAARPAVAGARRVPRSHHCSTAARSGRPRRRGTRRAAARRGSGDRPGVRALARRLARIRTRRARRGGARPRSCAGAAAGRSGRALPQGARPPRARRDRPRHHRCSAASSRRARSRRPCSSRARTSNAPRCSSRRTIAPARSSPTATRAACSAPTRVRGSSPHAPSRVSRRTRPSHAALIGCHHAIGR